MNAMVTNLSLLNLPAEIGVIILKFLLVRPYSLETNRDKAVCFRGSYARLPVARAQDYKEYGLAPQVLQTCKHLATEGLPLLYSNSFNLDSLPELDETSSTDAWLVPTTPFTIVSRRSLALMTKLEISCRIYDLTGSDDFVPDHSPQLLTALQLHASFQQQLRWVKCTIFNGEYFGPAVRHLGLKTEYYYLEDKLKFEAGDQERWNEIHWTINQFMFREGLLRVGRAAKMASELTRRIYRTYRL
jgi:hypothetical protein